MPGAPGSHMDSQFCADISSMARSLNRIANALEAGEARARKLEETTPEDAMQQMEFALRILRAVKRGFQDMESSIHEVGALDDPEEEEDHG